MKVFKAQINSADTGLLFISLVESPATDLDWIAFSKETEKLQFFDEEQHIIKGVVMEAGKPIYRHSPKYGEYYVIFDADTIKALMLKASKAAKLNSIDIEHNENPITGVYIVESYLIDRNKGINPTEFANVNDFSWVASYKVENDELWQKIKSGELNGFSISGIFDLVPDEEINELENILDEIL